MCHVNFRILKFLTLSRIWCKKLSHILAYHHNHALTRIIKRWMTVQVVDGWWCSKQTIFGNDRTQLWLLLVIMTNSFLWLINRLEVFNAQQWHELFAKICNGLTVMRWRLEHLFVFLSCSWPNLILRFAIYC